MTQVYEDPLLLRMLSWFFFKAIVVFSTRDNYIISSCTVFMELTHFLSLNRRLIMRGYCLSDWRVLWDLGKSGVVKLEKMGRVLFFGEPNYLRIV